MIVMRYNMRRGLVLVALCLMAVVSWATTVRVGVLLPLKEKTSRGTTLVEFYRGLLMAVEAVKQEGTNVELTTLDCGSSAAQMQLVLQEPQCRNFDVVFGPIDVVQVAPLADFCRQHQIRMVLPFNTPCSQVYSNPWVYQVGVAQELLYPGISKLVIDHMENSNFVFYNSGEQQDERAQSFTTHLAQVLKLRNMQTTTLAAGADEFGFDRAFNQFRENVVILDSRSSTALNTLITSIKAYQEKYPQYKIRLLGYPEWLTYTRSMLKDLYHFDTYVYSTYYRNPLSGRVVKFEYDYQQNFGVRSRDSYPRAEMLGYDLAYYFMHGIAQFGKELEEKHANVEQRPIQHRFNFQRIGQYAGFVNLNVQLVHYKTDNTIQVER